MSVVKGGEDDSFDMLYSIAEVDGELGVGGKNGGTNQSYGAPSNRETFECFCFHEIVTVI